MGTDFDTRKRNKKLNKAAGHAAAADAGDKGKRERSKGRPKVGDASQAGRTAADARAGCRAHANTAHPPVCKPSDQDSIMAPRSGS